MTDFVHLKAQSLLLQDVEAARATRHLASCQLCAEWVAAGRPINAELEEFNKRATCMEVRVAFLDEAAWSPEEFAVLEAHLVECETCATWEVGRPLDDELRRHRDFGENMPTQEEIMALWHEATGT